MNLEMQFVLDYPRKPVERAFSDKMKALGFDVRRSRGLIAWRNLEKVQQRIRMYRPQSEPYLNLTLALRFQRARVVNWSPPDFDSPCDFYVGELGLASPMQAELIRVATRFFPPQETDVRVKALCQVLEEVVMPFFNEYTTVQPLIDRINPETGHVDPPGLAFRSFYDLIGQQPKVWPRPIP